MAKTIKLKRQGECFTVDAKNTGGQWYKEKFDGRTIKFKVCLIGPPPHANLSITRVGRRGGVRGSDKARAGMVACGPNGGASCIRVKDLFVFPGGGAAMKRKGVKMYNRYRRHKRRSRR